jgi:hypothetical protein
MTSLSIHGVQKIIIEDTKEQFSGSFVRDIKILTEQGDEIEIVLFTRRGPGALEPVSEAQEDWK